jgi:tubulin polyglutamylase TTLL2
VNTETLWERIRCMCILTLLPVVPDISYSPRCFELFGFDIMLDDALKPWLIEVNASPAISIDGHTDEAVKGPLLNDMLDW